jgi:hypothetical protein
MKSSDIMTSTAGGIMRATVCPSIKPMQRRFVVSDTQTRFSWSIRINERPGERAYHASLKGTTKAGRLLVGEALET